MFDFMAVKVFLALPMKEQLTLKYITDMPNEVRILIIIRLISLETERPSESKYLILPG